LDKDVKALLDEQVVVEHNESEGQWQDVVAIADLEEFADALL
jgi:hypothetical protein